MIETSKRGKDLYLNQEQLRKINKGINLEDGGSILPFLPLLLPMLKPVLKSITGGGCDDCEMKRRVDLLEASGFFSDLGSKVKTYLKRTGRDLGEKAVDSLTKKARDLAPRAIEFAEKEAKKAAEKGITAAEKRARTLLSRVGS